MKNIIENIKLVVSMTIIGAILLYIGTMVFMPNLTIKIFRFQPFVVVTESMEPVINVNDMIIATPFDIEEAKVGDIITFEADIDFNGTKEVVTHYIYSIDRTGETPIIRTNRHFEEGEEIVPDTWLLTSNDIIGTHSTTIKYAGLLVGFLKSTLGIAVIVFNIVIISAIAYINKLHEKQKQQDQQPSEKTDDSIKAVMSLIE